MKQKKEKIYQYIYKKDGILNGDFQEWYPNGKVKAKAIFTNGNGYIYYYYENGKLQKEGNIINEKETGLWKYYYENGIKRSEGYYKNGIKNGSYKVWNQKGELIESGKYKNGIIVPK